VARIGLPVPEWTFGGGTVLMLRHRHRLSRDVDIFLHDAQVLPALSPRLNPEAERLTADYSESATHVKLRLAGGEVDFIVAPRLLGLAPLPLEFEGRVLAADPSAEIVAKKLFYRCAGLQVRDVLDLAVVLEGEPEAAALLRPILRGRAAPLRRRVETLAPTFATDAAELRLLPAGTAALAGAAGVAAGFVDTLE